MRHLKPLDGVRGLAILMVMVSHGFEANLAASSLPVRFLGGALYYGKFGVDLFFVLSGFLITGILIDTRHDPGYFRRFFARRALRILPLYYGVLFVLLGMTPWLHFHWSGMAMPLLMYLQNFRPATIDHLHLSPGIGLYHFWSLAVEEQFYLVWPVIVYWLRGSRHGVLRAAMAGALLALALRLVLLRWGDPGLFIHYGTPTRMDSLLLGGVLAVLFRSPADWVAVTRWAPAAFGLLCLPVVVAAAATGGYEDGHFYWTTGVRYTVLALAFAALLAWSLTPASVAGRLFEQRWLRTLGKYSYGLYVLHVLVMGFNPPLRLRLLQLTHSKLAAVAGAGIACMGLSLLAAFLSFQLYEKHFLRFKHRFDYRRVETAPPAAKA